MHNGISSVLYLQELPRRLSGALLQCILPLTDMERARYQSCSDSIGSPHARAKGLMFSSASLPVELAHSSDKEQVSE